MKRLFLFMVGVIPLVMSCSKSDTDDIASAIYEDNDKLLKEIATMSRGSFGVAWTIDNNLVDTATFSNQDDFSLPVISHFPMEYFMKILYSGRNPEDFKEENLRYNHWSSWQMDLAFVGLSTKNVYFSNTSLDPSAAFILDNVYYQCKMWTNTGQSAIKQTALIYDMDKDVWSGVMPLDSLSITNMKTSETRTLRGGSSPILMSFQTTGRKK